MQEWKTIEYKGVQFELMMQSSETAISVRIAGSSYNRTGVMCDDPYSDKPYFHIKNKAPLLIGYPDIKEFHVYYYSLQEAIWGACDALLERPSDEELDNKKERSKEMMREAWDTIDAESEFRPRGYMR